MNNRLGCLNILTIIFVKKSYYAILMYKKLIMNRIISLLILIILSFNLNINSRNNRIIANPLNLNYRFQPTDKGEYRREAADPVIEFYKNKYYLFASKSGGYWSSNDLVDWTYIPCKSISEIENYAPTVFVYNDTLYYIASGSKIYKTTNPDADNWEMLNTDLTFLGPQKNDPYHDPFLFKDDDGKVYFYWGCSDRYPIEGVEVNPQNNFTPIGEKVTLISHNQDKYGWEVRGENNMSGKPGYNEGPCVIKYNGKYYLQYAAPGTEIRVYGDGTYVSDNPLGPYTYEESNPFSLKPGGFIGGAGHGHTFKDKYGNYWHVATMKISKRHMFERRLGLFPVYVSDDNVFHAHTAFTDYPFEIPTKKIHIEKNDLSKKWNLLSYKKITSASSSLIDHSNDKASDEQIETWWSAQTGNKDEWWKVDLGKSMEVTAIQVNFADQDFQKTNANSYTYYQYFIECSQDGKNWEMLVDRTENKKDMPHELLILNKKKKVRYLKITNAKNMEGKFSIYDFRVFGNGKGEKTQPVKQFIAKRNTDRRRFDFSWAKVENASGYIIHWGVKKDKLENETMIMNDNKLEAGYFNGDSEYFFSIDSFNENGITKGTEIYNVK